MMPPQGSGSSSPPPAARLVFFSSTDPAVQLDGFDASAVRHEGTADVVRAMQLDIQRQIRAFLRPGVAETGAL